MSFETWKCTEPEGSYPGPSNDKIRQDIAIRKQKIEWNINRLVNLVLSDEDRQLTEDYIMDLRDEVKTLERCFNVGG